MLLGKPSTCSCQKSVWESGIVSFELFSLVHARYRDVHIHVFFSCVVCFLLVLGTDFCYSKMFRSLFGDIVEQSTLLDGILKLCKPCWKIKLHYSHTTLPPVPTGPASRFQPQHPMGGSFKPHPTRLLALM